MSKYLVIDSFKDLQDNKYQYKAGDTYPRLGLEPSKQRIKELSTTNNRRGKVFIVPDEKEEAVTKTDADAVTVTEVETEEKTVEAEKPKRSRKKKDAD